MLPIRVTKLKAYEIQPAPVYLYLRKNARFVAIKGTYDFFLPEELQRLAAVEELFHYQKIRELDPIFQCAQKIRGLLQMAENQLAPFEASDLIMKQLSELMNAGRLQAIDDIFVLANQVCGQLPTDFLIQNRNKDIVVFEEILKTSAWAVWISLILGNNNWNYLYRIWASTFQTGVPYAHDAELSGLSKNSFNNPRYFSEMNDSYSKRIQSRISQRAKLHAAA